LCSFFYRFFGRFSNFFHVFFFFFFLSFQFFFVRSLRARSLAARGPGASRRSLLIKPSPSYLFLVHQRRAADSKFAIITRRKKVSLRPFVSLFASIYIYLHLKKPQRRLHFCWMGCGSSRPAGAPVGMGALRVDVERPRGPAAPFKVVVMGDKGIGKSRRVLPPPPKPLPPPLLLRLRHPPHRRAD
jgi:hypothetical protein